MKKVSALAGVFFLAACAGEGEPVEEESGGAEEAAENQQNDNEENDADEEEEADGLTISMQADAQSLDPHFGNDHYSLNVKRAIYDTLVMTDENLDLHMGLATSFEQIEPETWEIELEEDIVFHDGEELNAEVVQLNIERMLDPELGSPVAFMFDMIEEVDIVDDHTLQLHTEYPFAPLRTHFAHPAGQIISPDVIEADYAAVGEGEDPGSVVTENPVGTGFYELEEQEPGDYYELTQNEDYWRGEAGAEHLTFEVVPEDLTRVGELETGEADVIGHLNPNDVERLEENEDTDVARYDSASLAYLGFQTELAPFDDADVRRAVAKAVNKEDIISSAIGGAALQADGPLAPPVFGSSDDLDVIEEDLEAAEELLAGAGYEDGLETEIWIDDSRVDRDIAEILQAQLAPIGIDLEIESLEAGVHRDYISDGEAPMFISSWGTVTGDADYGLYPVFHSSNHGISGNRTFYDNEDVDELLEAARQEEEDEERLALYHDAQQIIMNDVPMVPLYHREHLAGVSSDLENFVIHPSSLYDLFPVHKGN
ncbi:glutathione ABC transporter substrate-binding protein [Alkalicoccus chagannorensis]|uniref:glutathione ABC transporter substrate-binding protein n=1 Tax=Alkalicoccus chagannorensis TaxID=427072 RepID=UPI00042A6CCA|nr:glutathione ABC transporter substrate-binding protein [Alkalicoccus chagannorensis]